MRPLLPALVALVAGCLLACSGDGARPGTEELPGMANASVHIMVTPSRRGPTKGTFGWGYVMFKLPPGGEEHMEPISQRLEAALVAELGRKGLELNEANPDLVVSYAVADGEEIDANELNEAHGELLNLPDEGAADDIHYNRGVLVVDILHRESGVLLWRGAIMADIDRDWPEERRQDRANAAIRELMRHYPVPRDIQPTAR